MLANRSSVLRRIAIPCHGHRLATRPLRGDESAMRRRHLSVCPKWEFGPLRRLIFFLLLASPIRNAIAWAQSVSGLTTSNITRSLRTFSRFLPITAFAAMGRSARMPDSVSTSSRPTSRLPRVAERWKEVVDMINLGVMPPEDEPRPTPDEFEPVVDWIHRGLRDAERAARTRVGGFPCGV